MLLLFCTQNSPRLKYTIDWICKLWQISYEISESEERFQVFEGPKIYYGSKPAQEASISVIASGFLVDQNLKRIEPKYGTIEEMPVLFKDESDFGFDVFSAVFFMLSRYEEYLPFQPDQHGRFPAKNSIAAQHGFLGLPVADMWILYLKNEIKKKFPKLEFGKSHFDVLITFDIDLAYKYKGKPFLRNFGGFANDLFSLRFKNLYQRLGVLFQFKKDPWDVYSELLTSLSEHGIRSIFFFPAGRRSKFDKNLSPESSIISRLIKKISVQSEVGLHPSYYSTEKPDLVFREKSLLEAVLKNHVLASRQHFLKFKLPGTYVALIESGIKHDFSMGFPDYPGFRAGTSKPFFFYDLKNERSSALEIFPCSCMDQTYISYLRYDTSQTLESMKRLMAVTAQYNGLFIPVFHNHTFENKDWLVLYHELIKNVVALKNPAPKKTA